MKITAILLSKNEGINVVYLYREIMTNFSEEQIEVLVVEDGKDELQSKNYSQLLKQNNFRMIKREISDGLAGATKYGISKAKGDYVVVLDADGTHNPKDIKEMMAKIQKLTIVIASRFLKGGSMEHKIYRFTSRIFNYFIQIKLNTGVRDNLGGFYLMSKTTAMLLLQENIFIGHGDYLIRLILFAKKQGIEIVEVPTKFRHRFTGKTTRSRWWMITRYLRTIWELDSTREK